jgi:pimeloyl-ACP methyl ester carboxylesterase
MIAEKKISANGITQNYRIREGEGEYVVFIHGNGSDSVFWLQTMEDLPAKFTAIAPDLRGYGMTEAVPAKASKSYGDFVNDILGLLEELKIESYHLVAHSLGGGVAWELLIKDASRIRSLTQINPASPFGFGGTKDEKGTLNFSDGAGSGGGTINTDFVKLIQNGDRTTHHEASPLNIMNLYYWEPPFIPNNIDSLLEGLLRIQIGDKFYPGDFKESPNYPFVAPGSYGPINAASPLSKSDIFKKLVSVKSGPPILWVRGLKDKIVSNESLFDSATLGKMGAIPNYPGADVCPSQPMIDQTRYCLDAYARENGNSYREVVFENSGHTPYLEEPERFMNELLKHLN